MNGRVVTAMPVPVPGALWVLVVIAMAIAIAIAIVATAAAAAAAAAAVWSVSYVCVQQLMQYLCIAGTASVIRYAAWVARRN